MSVDVRCILDELNVLRPRDRMDVALMTLVAFFDDAAVGDWLRDRLHALTSKDPARVLLMDDSQAQSACRVSADWVEFGVAGTDPQTLQSVVASLALPQVPLVLVWASRHIADDSRFAALSPSARTIVYNSSALGSDDGGLRALIAFERAHPDALLSDVAYLRLAPWQECIALFFDGKGVIRELFDLRRVEIASGSAAEAYYLLGWLASRLEWKSRGNHRFCNRFGTEIEFSIDHDGPPRRISRVALQSSQSRFVAELRAGGQDAITLTVAGAAAQPPRCHPVADLGTAALIERAILTGNNDRIFHDTLLAAAAILTCEEAPA